MEIFCENTINFFLRTVSWSKPKLCLQNNNENKTHLEIKKKKNYHLDEPVAMNKGVVVCEKKNAMVIRAVRIFCFRNKMNIILAFHQYL